MLMSVWAMMKHAPDCMGLAPSRRFASGTVYVLRGEIGREMTVLGERPMAVKPLLTRQVKGQSLLNPLPPSPLLFGLGLGTRRGS